MTFLLGPLWLLVFLAAVAVHRARR
jgi:hypothetical protein